MGNVSYGRDKKGKENGKTGPEKEKNVKQTAPSVYTSRTQEVSLF